jgi:predicted RNase H-like nuclease (RuvC/YqgF family)
MNNNDCYSIAINPQQQQQRSSQTEHPPNLEERVNQMAAEFNKKLSEQSIQLKALTDENTALKKQVKELQDENAALKKQVKRQDEQMESLSADLKDFKNRMRELRYTRRIAAKDMLISGIAVRYYSPFSFFSWF